MKIFSFRAECLPDVESFNEALLGAGMASSMTTHADDDGLPDVDVELHADATLERLQDLLRQVEDGHVMLQTLRAVPLAENSLERDYDLT